MLSPEELAAKKQEALALVEQTRASVDIQNAPFEVKRKVLRLVVDEITLNTTQTFTSEVFIRNL